MAFDVALVVSVFVESAFALHVLAAFDAVATFAVTAADSTAVPQTPYCTSRCDFMQRHSLMLILHHLPLAAQQHAN